jgi:anti-anti-sigma factor
MEAQCTMSNAIEIGIRHRGDVAVIDIKGDVTAFTGEPIEDAYEQVSTEGLQKILCVFDKKCYINSGGIAILISIVGESQEREQTIRFAGLSEHFQKIFDMVGLTRYIKIFPSEEAALEGF